MTTTRRLAAILAADVAGYSAAMERDEEGTATAVRTLRREVIEPKLAEHQGRLIKTTGDGFLAEFASPIAALKCALAIQQRPNDGGGLKLRIGLNLGDVIIEESGDLLGEGVNIAARLEGLAEPDGILVSGKIHSEVEGKVEATFEDRGEQQVKNIARAVRVYAVRTGASSLSASAHDTKPLPLPDKPSIAVLPFQNMSGDPEQEYFADGMVEDIITALSRFKSLFVIARNSSFTYKGKAVDIKQVGKELGVRYVLEGSVRKAGGRVRITGQLIEAVTGTHLWANRFDGELEEVFDLQDMVTEQVVGAIAAKVERAEVERATRKPTEHLDAYDCFLRGWQSFQLETAEGYDIALDYFKKAIGLDPSYARAYALAARTYSRKATDGLGTNWADVIKFGEPYVRKAIALGQEDDTALLSAGLFMATALHDPEAGRNLLDQALSLNPNSQFGWLNRAWVSMQVGDHEQAMQQLERALRISPVDPMIYHVETAIAHAQFFLHRFDQALHWAGKALARRPVHLLALRVACWSHVMVGDLKKAEAMLSEFPTIGAKSISAARRRLLWRQQDDIDLWCDVLRRLGIPE